MGTDCVKSLPISSPLPYIAPPSCGFLFDGISEPSVGATTSGLAAGVLVGATSSAGFDGVTFPSSEIVGTRDFPSPPTGPAGSSFRFRWES